MASDLPPGLGDARRTLQQLAVHVLARRRHAVTGRFGLRASPGGLATPAFGDEVEVVRTSGATLVVEQAGAGRAEPVTTLAAAARLVGVDLGADFSVGDDTPAMAGPDEPLPLDDRAARALAGWWALGTVALDELVATEPAVAQPTAPQLWPEHFDVACTVAAAPGGPGGPGEAPGRRANLGASPGDGFEAAPYLYVGPWDADRPGDAGYWNAPFGAVLRHADLAGLAPDRRLARAVDFLRTGVRLLAAA